MTIQSPDISHTPGTPLTHITASPQPPDSPLFTDNSTPHSLGYTPLPLPGLRPNDIQDSYHTTLIPFILQLLQNSEPHLTCTMNWTQLSLDFKNAIAIGPNIKKQKVPCANFLTANGLAINW
jgi:hypothetical protein